MDVLLKLYDLPRRSEPSRWEVPGVVIRRALAAERTTVLAWIDREFGVRSWVDEAAIAFARVPVSCAVALVDSVLAGFLCTEVSARGFIGPGGVGEPFRRRGVFTALLLQAAYALYDAGYAYAVIGDAADATILAARHFTEPMLIPGSSPGIYAAKIREPNAE